MSRLVFGRDDPPTDRPVPMAYVGRAACGHIRAMALDNRPSALTDFVGMGLAGLTLERLPAEDAKAEFGRECPLCEPPEQLELGA